MRVFLLVVMLVLGVWGDELSDSIKNIIGQEKFDSNQRLINRVLKNKKKFYTSNQQLNFYEIIKTLKDNNLINFPVDQAQDIRISFIAKAKPMLLIQATNNLFSSLGYTQFMIERAQYIQNETLLTYLLTSAQNIDPILMMEEFQKRGINIKNIQVDENKDWLYGLVVQNFKIPNIIELKKSDNLKIENLSGEYWFLINDAGRVKISRTDSSEKWNPRIVLYDKDFEVLNVLTYENLVKSVEVKTNKQTAYVMVTDLNDPSRLRTGINVVFSVFKK